MEFDYQNEYQEYLKKREELIKEGIPYPIATNKAWKEVYINKIYPLTPI